MQEVSGSIPLTSTNLLDGIFYFESDPTALRGEQMRSLMPWQHHDVRQGQEHFDLLHVLQKAELYQVREFITGDDFDGVQEQNCLRL